MSKRVIGLTAIVILVIWGALTLQDLRAGALSAPPTAAPTPTPAVTGEGAQSLAYAELARNAEAYVGQTVYYEGRATAIVEQAGSQYGLQVEVTRSPYGAWDDTVYVTCQAEGLREGDVVRVQGTVRGRFSYRGVLGNTVTLPWVEATAVERVEQAVR